MDDQIPDNGGIIEGYTEATTRTPIPKEYTVHMMVMHLAEDHPNAVPVLMAMISECGKVEAAKLFRRLDDMNIAGQQIVHAYYNICAGIPAEFIDAVSAGEKGFVKAMNDPEFKTRWYVVAFGAVKLRQTREGHAQLEALQAKPPATSAKASAALADAQAAASARVGKPPASGTRAAVMGAKDRVAALNKQKATTQPKKYKTPTIHHEGDDIVLRNGDGSEFVSPVIGKKLEIDEVTGYPIRNIDFE